MTAHCSVEQRADHEHDLRKHEWRPGDRMPIDQRTALAELIGYCEGVVKSGILSTDMEMSLRVRIARALAAFEMPSKAERAQPVVA